jgi:ferric-dicitrate binding protein FerR (iron transport regulator)
MELRKYTEDKKFIHWVFDPDPELDAWWNQFKIDHPEEKRNIQLARNILLKFRTKNKELSNKEKILLFSRILKQTEQKHKSVKVKRLMSAFMKYAAVAVLFFCVGAMLFHKNDENALSFDFRRMEEPVTEGSAKLIRSNGEKILLKENKSVLQYHANGTVVVNSDTLVSQTSTNEKETAINEIVNPYGKTTELMLTDGTKVFLNAGSRLIYPENFTGKNRKVFLVGEAYFDVKHDEEHPFIVQLSDIRIKVLGTRFNVSAYPGDKVIETVLEEGKVCVRENNAGFFDKSTELTPDQMACFNKVTRETNVKKVDADDYTLWTKGLMKLESTDLCRIVKKLERFYNIRIQFRDPLLGGLRISGKLDLKKDKDEVCERVARAASVKIVKKNGDLYEIIK